MNNRAIYAETIITENKSQNYRNGNVMVIKPDE